MTSAEMRPVLEETEAQLKTGEETKEEKEEKKREKETPKRESKTPDRKRRHRSHKTAAGIEEKWTLLNASPQLPVERYLLEELQALWFGSFPLPLRPLVLTLPEASLC